MMVSQDTKLILLILMHMHLAIIIYIYIHAAVQILFVKEREHWVTSSYHGGEVRLYDSCSTGGLTPSLEEQLVQVYRPAIENCKLMVTLISVQQQDGVTECGVYCIANAYNAALGRSLSEVTYKKQEMRAHLEQCFEDEKLSPFPPATAPVQKSTLQHLSIQLHCLCGLPETYDSQMVECEDCQKWFHFRCVGLKSEPQNWLCPNCDDKVNTE